MKSNTLLTIGLIGIGSLFGVGAAAQHEEHHPDSQATQPSSQTPTQPGTAGPGMMGGRNDGHDEHDDGTESANVRQHEQDDGEHGRDAERKRPRENEVDDGAAERDARTGARPDDAAGRHDAKHVRDDDQKMSDDGRRRQAVHKIGIAQGRKT